MAGLRLGTDCRELICHTIRYCCGRPRCGALRSKKKFCFKALVYTYLNKSLKKYQKKERKYFGDSKTLCNFATANGKQRGSPLKARKRKLKMPL